MNEVSEKLLRPKAGYNQHTSPPSLTTIELRNHLITGYFEVNMATVTDIDLNSKNMIFQFP